MTTEHGHEGIMVPVRAPPRSALHCCYLGTTSRRTFTRRPPRLTLNGCLLTGSSQSGGILRSSRFLSTGITYFDMKKRCSVLWWVRKGRSGGGGALHNMAVETAVLATP